MRLTLEQLRPAFATIRYLGTRIKPRSGADSIVTTCCTQFELAYSLSSVKALELCDRILKNLVIDDNDRAMLSDTVSKLRAAIEASLPS